MSIRPFAGMRTIFPHGIIPYNNDYYIFLMLLLYTLHVIKRGAPCKATQVQSRCSPSRQTGSFTAKHIFCIY
jgi:hypothetical protein